MTVYFAKGSPLTELSRDDLRAGLQVLFRELGPRQRVLAVPPDFTRQHSRAGLLTCLAHEQLGDALVDVMPALGTHDPMTAGQLAEMFPSLPGDRIRVHRWREDVVTVGEVPAEFVSEVTGGIHTRAWPAQMNRMLADGGHDLILSIGQVVPHEVIGMANHNKNIFVGTGGQAGINESHFIGAAYGMERMMGRADTPLRRILNYAEQHFCSQLPLVYVLTVVAANDAGQLVTRGLFIGDDLECFQLACQLSIEVNFQIVDQPLQKVVVSLDPDEFQSTWLGNKSVYRTRMAIADGGELIVLAPGVKKFGEDPQIDELIRKYGYRTTPEIFRLIDQNQDLRENLSAAAHLIHGSAEGRFSVTYCPGHLTREEIEGVGYQFAALEEMQARYPAGQLRDGWNETADGERIYYISNPALGLWAHRSRLID